MSTHATLTLESLLRLCADADPAPWYPSQHARTTGVDRDSLDEPLTQLRLAGLVRLTDWEPGQGQGYILTDAGRAILANPRALARLRTGDVPDAPVEPRPSSRTMTTWERGEAVRAALLAPDASPMTWLLIAAQLCVFLAAMYFALLRQVPLNQFLSYGRSPVLERLAVSVVAPAAGEWWRLVTYALVHGGALHLLFNLLGHVVLGPVVERMFGSVRLLALWLLSALGGGCAVVLAGHGWTVGSSGAVCGLLGATAAFVALNHRHLGQEQTAMWRRGLVRAAVLTIFISMMPRVSWSGHLGGAVVGAVAGLLLNYQRFGTTWQRWMALLGLIVLPVLCIGTLLLVREAERRAILRQVLVEKELRQRRAAEEQQHQRREEADFLQRLVPEIHRVSALSQRICLEHAGPLIRLPPLFRDGDQIKVVLVKIDVVAEELELADRLLAGAGPYQAPIVQEAQRRAVVLLETEKQLVAVSRHYLETAAPDDALRYEHIRRFEVAAEGWQALFAAHRPDPNSQ